MPDGHSQTLAGRFLRQNTPFDFERRTLETPDGDFLDLDFDSSIEEFTGNTRGRVLILHGLEGCSRSAYVLTTIQKLREHGLASVVLNFRSCGGEPNRLPRYYHSGETKDLNFVIRYLTDLTDRSLRGVVGFSLGGNVLLKYLGERSSVPVDSAAAVSVPFDLSAGADYLHRGLSRIYERYFLKQLKSKIVLKEKTHHHGFELSELDEIETLREFDNRFTAPLHGFDSAEDYYRKSSSRYYVDDVRVPTLVLHSRDDPFLPESAIPTKSLDANKRIRPRITRKGGHVGFIEGKHPLEVDYWAESNLAQFFANAGSFT